MKQKTKNKEEKKHRIQAFLLEKTGYNGAGEEYATLNAQPGTDISELLKEMKAGELAEARWDWQANRYICTSLPLKAGKLEERTYRVYRSDTHKTLYDLCRDFEKKQGGENGN